MLSRTKFAVPLLLLFALLLPAVSRSQQTGAFSFSTTGTTGSALLQAINQRAGWGIDWKSVSFSFSASATVTNADGSTTSFPISGESQKRWNVRLDAGATTFIVNGQKAWVVSNSGSDATPFDSVFEAVSLLPFMSDLADVSDPNLSSSYDGITQFNGTSAYQFTIRRPTAPDFATTRRLSMQATDTRVWFDQLTYLPIAIESIRPGLTNSSAAFRVRREYSNYKVISGIAVPFTIVESVEGLKSTFSITDVQFGSSFSASDFEAH